MNRVRAKNRIFVFSILALVFGVLALVSHLQIAEATQQGKVSVVQRSTAGQPVTVLSAQAQPREFADHLASKGIFRGAFLLGFLVTLGFAARYGVWMRRHPA